MLIVSIYGFFCRIVDGKLQVKTILPGLKVEYSTDNGLTWSDVTEKTKVDGVVLLRSRYVHLNCPSNIQL